MADLFAPLTVKNVVLQNRIVLPPMASALATAEGAVTEKHKEHYLTRARAGVGLIILEHAFIDPLGRASANQLGLDSDDKLPGLTDLVILHNTVPSSRKINKSREDLITRNLPL